MADAIDPITHQKRQDDTGPVSVKIQKVVHFLQDNVDDITIQKSLINTVLAEGLSPTVIRNIRQYGRDEIQRLEEELANARAALDKMLSGHSG